MRCYRLFFPALISTSLGSADAEVRYRAHSIPEATGFPGYYGGYALNDAGMIAGEAWMGPQLSGPFAFVSMRAEAGQTQPIGSLPTCDPQFAWVSAINNQDHVVGYDQGTNCEAMAFLWTAESGMQPLGDLPGGMARSDARGVNVFDQVVGWSQSANGQEAFFG